MELSAAAPNYDTDIIYLPKLRKDLTIVSAPPDEDGSPLWLLFDPLKNAYYRLGYKGFVIFSSWKEMVQQKLFLKELKAQDPDITTSDLNDFIFFIINNGLSKTPQKNLTEKFEQEYAQLNQSFFKKLILNYLYFRIPLINPDQFLAETMPYINFFFSPLFKKIIITTGIAGFLMVINQWDHFISTVQYFMNIKGLVFFLITLFFVKIIHEFGHGYTAKKYGCRVPSMGMAFLVLYPFLYTDTTDSWRLNSRKHRLNIVLGGIKAELTIAVISLFLWNFFNEGIIKSMLFFLATTSLIASLTINLSPFMRFDGYYALSDILGAENLQQRAFFLAKQKIRQLLIGYKEPPLETLSAEKEKIFLLYAYSTWIYRFLLFLGIALVVYHFAFKILGIFLFAIEIIYFLLAPIVRELKVWVTKAKSKKINKNIIFSLTLIAGIIAFLVFPWQSRIIVPGIINSFAHTQIYPSEKGYLKHVHVKEGQKVEKGQTLFTVVMPELENRQKLLKRKSLYLNTRINRYIGSPEDLNEIDILQKELAQTKAQLYAMDERIKKGIIKSPHKGVVSNIIRGKSSQWISRKDMLGEIIQKNINEITAYVSENDLHRIHNGANAYFYYKNAEKPAIKAFVFQISQTAVTALPHLETASIYGGSIPVYPARNNILKPVSGLYEIKLQPSETITNIYWKTPGNICIETHKESIVSNLWKYAASVFIRETAF